MQFYGKIAYSIVQFLGIFAYSIVQNCKNVRLHLLKTNLNDPIWGLQKSIRHMNWYLEWRLTSL